MGVGLWGLLFPVGLGSLPTTAVVRLVAVVFTLPDRFWSLSVGPAVSVGRLCLSLICDIRAVG